MLHALPNSRYQNYSLDMTVPEKHIYKLKFVTLLYTDTHPEFEYTHGYAHR